jgi:gas vesicle protein
MVTENVDYSMLAATPLFMFLGVGFLILILAVVFAPRKSMEYRKLMTDMFVVGKIKQLANDDDIDLKIELKEFAKFMKEKKIDTQELDSTIERELQERIAKTTEDTNKKADVVIKK